MNGTERRHESQLKTAATGSALRDQDHVVELLAQPSDPSWFKFSIVVAISPLPLLRSSPQDVTQNEPFHRTALSSLQATTLYAYTKQPPRNLAPLHRIGKLFHSLPNIRIFNHFIHYATSTSRARCKSLCYTSAQAWKEAPQLALSLQPTDTDLTPAICHIFLLTCSHARLLTLSRYL